MMKPISLAEGFILQTLKFQEYDAILTVFTRNSGIEKFFVKGAFSTKYGKGAMTEPFSCVELAYTEGRSDLLTCREISTLSSHYALRQSLPAVKAAFEMAQALLRILMPHQSAQAIYDLFEIYLKTLPTLSDPGLLSASFRLKLLRSEGILDIGGGCAMCQATTDNMWAAGGEFFCERHAPALSIEWEDEEFLIMQGLALSRSLSQIASLVPPQSFYKKIDLLFRELSGSEGNGEYGNPVNKA